LSIRESNGSKAPSPGDAVGTSLSSGGASGDAVSGDGGASLVFWMLIALALTVMAPCMILPAWREYQAAELRERTRAAEAAAYTRHADRLEQRLDAIHNDPVVIERLARRELRCTLPGEVRLAVSNPNAADWAADTFTPATYSAAGADGADGPADTSYAELFRERTPVIPSAEFQPVQPPVGIARLTHYLPRLNYDALFCSAPTRGTLLGMSLTLVAAAFIIFWPRLPKS